MKWKAKIIPSNLSNNPPCPGIIFPVSFIFESRLKYETVKSPIWLTVEINNIIISVSREKLLFRHKTNMNNKKIH